MPQYLGSQHCPQAPLIIDTLSYVDQDRASERHELTPLADGLQTGLSPICLQTKLESQFARFESLQFVKILNISHFGAPLNSSAVAV